MALPAAAIIQATISTYMTRHEVVESELTREEVEAVEGVAEEMVSELDDAAREGMLRLGDRSAGRPRREGLSTYAFVRYARPIARGPRDEGAGARPHRSDALTKELAGRP